MVIALGAAAWGRPDHSRYGLRQQCGRGLGPGAAQPACPMGSSPAGADADLVCLFATLRGSPFADVPYNINVKVLPADQIAAVETKPFNSASHSIFFTENDHVPAIALARRQQARCRRERDISHSSVERMMLPDVSVTLHFMLREMTKVVSGLAGLPRHHGAQHEPLRRCGVQPNGVAGLSRERHEPRRRLPPGAGPCPCRLECGRRQLPQGARERSCVTIASVLSAWPIASAPSGIKPSSTPFMRG